MSATGRRAQRGFDRSRRAIFPRKELWEIVERAAASKGMSASSYILEILAVRLGKPGLA